MKLQARISPVKIKPTGNKCIECGKCNAECPMDIDIKQYIKNGQKILSTECIFCRTCVHKCPVHAIA
jgi:ferredoxin